MINQNHQGDGTSQKIETEAPEMHDKRPNSQTHHEAMHTELLGLYVILTLTEPLK